PFSNSCKLISPISPFLSVKADELSLFWLITAVCGYRVPCVPLSRCPRKLLKVCKSLILLERLAQNRWDRRNFRDSGTKDRCFFRLGCYALAHARASALRLYFANFAVFA